MPAFTPPRRAVSALFALLSLVLAGCGWDDRDGTVIVTNYTDSGTPEDVVAFRLARFGDPFTGNLLSSPLPAGSTRFVGDFREDYYDAEADMDLGDLVEWFDVWVEADDDTYFDVY